VAAVAPAAADRWPRLVIERKGAIAVALHWRTDPGAVPPIDEVSELASRHGLTLLPGRMVVELRPPLPVDKGTAVESLLSGAGILHGAFAGDDVGDLAAYDALDRMVASGALEHAVRVAVRSEESPPELVDRADAVVDGPEGLVAALTDTIAALER
jgi:trehalose 6-phosphate phosphatase